MFRSNKLTIFLGLCLSLCMMIACTAETPDTEPDQPVADTPEGRTATTPSIETVTLDTSDGYTITGSFLIGTGDGPHPACLLVHQLGADKSTYTEFQQALANSGISSLAIDMRGHGESAMDDFDYRALDNNTWPNVVNDLIAGLDYLRSNNGVDPQNIGIVGASIGANLAVIATADEETAGVENTAKCLVLLSPGLMYHGIRPNPRARELGGRPTFITAAREDVESFGGAQSLMNATRSRWFAAYDGDDHGTALFTAHPELQTVVIDWLDTIFSGGTPEAVESE